MATATIDTDIVESPQAQAYFTKADRRVMIGLRATLEMLHLPVPSYAHRGYSGKSPAKIALALYNADHPSVPSTILPERKPNATPERIATLEALRASGMGAPANGTFGETR